jgi:hypothetical protein
MEIAIQSPSAWVVVGNGRDVDRSSARRLHLAADRAGKPLWLINASPGDGWASAARFQWRVEPEPASAERPRWRINLVKRRIGRLQSMANLYAGWDRPKAVQRRRVRRHQADPDSSETSLDPLDVPGMERLSALSMDADFSENTYVLEWDGHAGDVVVVEPVGDRTATEACGGHGVAAAAEPRTGPEADGGEGLSAGSKPRGARWHGAD